MWKDYNEMVWKPYMGWLKKHWIGYLLFNIFILAPVYIYTYWDEIKEAFQKIVKKVKNEEES